MLKTSSLGRWGSAAALIGIAAAARAVVIFDFSIVVTGATPGGAAPWATLSISDSGADTVDMTLSHNASSAAGQFLTRLWLNMSPYPSSPAIIHSSPKITGATFSENGVHNAGGDFDMEVRFETSNAGGGVNRLKPGESVSWKITGSGLTESAFLANSGGSLNVLGMIHVQGINGEDSGKIVPVPEPVSVATMGIGLLGLFVRRRRARA